MDTNKRRMIEHRLLLSELELAHQIIANALNLMTPEQKRAWGNKNRFTCCDGEGITRANERLELINRVKEGE